MIQSLSHAITIPTKSSSNTAKQTFNPYYKKKMSATGVNNPSLAGTETEVDGNAANNDPSSSAHLINLPLASFLQDVHWYPDLAARREQLARVEQDLYVDDIVTLLWFLRINYVQYLTVFIPFAFRSYDGLP